MNRIHAGLEYRDFVMPSSIEKKTICTETGLLARAGSCPSITEYFAPDTVPDEVCPGHEPEPEEETPENTDPNNPGGSGSSTGGGTTGGGTTGGGTTGGGESGGGESGGGESGGGESGGGESGGDTPPQ